MEITVISDIHANYPALEAILADTPAKSNSFIFLGDAVGILGSPQQTVEVLKQKSLVAITGNHDISVLEQGTGQVISDELSEFEYNLTEERLTQSQKDWLISRPPYKETTLGGVGMLLGHASYIPEQASGLHSGRHGIHKRDFTAAASAVGEWCDYILLGHTHQQAALDAERFGHDVIVLNPGSAGQPLTDGSADYAVVDTDKHTYSMHSASYNPEPVKEHLRSTGVPIEWWD